MAKKFSKPVRKHRGWSEEYRSDDGQPEYKTARLDMRVTQTAKDWAESQEFAPAVVMERLARNIWTLSGPDLDDDDNDE